MTAKYFGYIMRVNLECKKKSEVKRYCVVFKAKGTLSCKCFSYIALSNVLCSSSSSLSSVIIYPISAKGGTQVFRDSTPLTRSCGQLPGIVFK